MSILGLYPSILHTLRMGGQSPHTRLLTWTGMGGTGLASCWWEPDPKRECVRVRGRDRDRHADRGRHLSLGPTRRSPFLTIWSQPMLAPEAKALITLVALLSSVWLPAHPTIVPWGPFSLMKRSRGHKVWKAPVWESGTHRCLEHVFHLMSDDKVEDRMVSG